jgi:hypothetical protein
MLQDTVGDIKSFFANSFARRDKQKLKDEIWGIESAIEGMVKVGNGIWERRKSEGRWPVEAVQLPKNIIGAYRELRRLGANKNNEVLIDRKMLAQLEGLCTVLFDMNESGQIREEMFEVELQDAITQMAEIMDSGVRRDYLLGGLKL